MNSLLLALSLLASSAAAGHPSRPAAPFTAQSTVQVKLGDLIGIIGGGSKAEEILGRLQAIEARLQAIEHLLQVLAAPAPAPAPVPALGAPK